MTSVAALEVDALTVAYFRKIYGVRDASVTVFDGEIVALIGPNGAGKTSTLRAVAGFLPGEPGSVASGYVRFRGRTLNNLPPYRIAREGIALVPERDKVFLELTPMEHFKLCAPRSESRREIFQAQVERVLEFFPGLSPHLRRPAGYFSGGQRQMLAIACALFRKPQLLLIDEFSQGLAPIIVNSLSQSILEMNRAGLMVLLVEQNARLALSMASRVYVLDGGEIVGAGSPSELEASHAIRSAYLGSDFAAG